MDVAHFADIAEEFMARVAGAVYCNMATVDRRGRPRSRMIHPVWEGHIGWLITWPQSHKAKHLQHNPHVSLAYIHDKERPVYVECVAAWVTDRAEMERGWEIHKQVPPPIGFDPTPHYGNIDHHYFGLLRFTPWRIELATLGGESRIWRQELGDM